MELKLTVLAGAKKGTSIPLKKNEFVIGRSSECALRAGSEAISRRHCLIERTEEGFTVRDLGSRNGTFVNDEKIASATPLSAGDTLRVGPLTFCVEPLQKKAKVASEPAATEAAEAPAEPTHGLKKSKQPPIKGVADVAARLADHGDQETLEDDISRWLIGSEVSTPANSETVNFHVDETRALKRAEVSTVAEEDDTDDTLDARQQDEETEETAESTNGEAEATDDGAKDDDDSNSRWSLFGHGKKNKDSGPGRGKPGKLPQRPEKDKAKDSCEAAANVLREMTRRR